MSAYVYPGTGEDVLPGCAEGHHVAHSATDRTGVWFWLCRRGCGAERPQGGTWTAPREAP